MHDEKQLLREYVRSVLQEKTVIHGPGSNEMQWGGDLADIFVKPFTEAGKVISTELKKLKVMGAATISRLLRGLASVVTLGGFKPKWEEITRREEAAIAKLENEPGYREVFKRVTDSGVEGLRKTAFLLDPVGFIAGDLVRQNPKAALLATGAIASGSPATVAALTSLWPTIKDQIVLSGKGASRSSDKADSTNFMSRNLAAFEDVARKYGLIEGSEKATNPGNVLLSEAEFDRKAVTKMMQSFLSHPEVVKVLKSKSEFAKGVESALGKAGEQTAADMKQLMAKVNRAKSLDELSKILGVDFREKLEGVDLDKQSESVILKDVKQSIKQHAVVEIGKYMKSKLGVELKQGQEHPYFKAMLDLVKTFY